MRFIFAILIAAAFFAGISCQRYIPAETPRKIENRTYCLYGQYASLKEYSSTKIAPQSAVDVGPKGVTVWVRCP